MEHRWGHRIVVDVPILLTSANVPSMKSGQLANLSITGALIKAEFRPRVLSRVQIVFVPSLSQHRDVLSIAAYVTRTDQDGIGVEWCEWASPAATDLLRAVISEPAQNVQYARVIDSAPLALRGEATH